MTNLKPGTLTLIGSGEMADSMVKVHRSLLARAPTTANAVFVDTPAGFELNIDDIAIKATTYFQQRLNTPLAIASYKSLATATALSVATALHHLLTAHYIFAGPGSPSYAVRVWRDSVVWHMLVARWLAGAQLVFASAASIALGHQALPVYEIYKAGAEPHWINGLDLLAPLGLKLAIVPHWNNAEGNRYDSRYCYMGEPRLRALEAQLPADAVILGIDEYTACVLDVQTQQCEVMGAGRVTLRHQMQEQAFAAGQTFPFTALRAPAGTMLQTDAAPASVAAFTTSPQLFSTTLYLAQLTRAIDETTDVTAQQTLIAQAHDALHNLTPTAHHHAATDADIAPYVEMLIATRAQLRAAKQFALADEIRERLGAQNIVIEDTPSGALWKKTG